MATSNWENNDDDISIVIDWCKQAMEMTNDLGLLTLRLWLQIDDDMIRVFVTNE